MPLVSAARAVADTALEYRYGPPVRAMVTGAVQRGLCTPQAIVDELEAGPRNDSAMLRRAVADVLGGARSVAEAEAADVLRRGGLPSFELNAPILDADGRLIAIADVLWRELRAIAEIDSREFHFSEQDWKRTMRRHNRLTAAGYAVMHVPPSLIRSDPDRWLDEVRAGLSARASELGVPGLG